MKLQVLCFKNLTQKISVLFLGGIFFSMSVYTHSSTAENRTEYLAKMINSPLVISLFSPASSLYLRLSTGISFFEYRIWGQPVAKLFSNVSSENSEHFIKINLQQYIPDQPTKVSMWVLGPAAEVFTPDLRFLENKFSQIEVELIPFSEEEIYFKELNSAFAQGREPDIFLTNTLWLKEFQHQKKLAPAPEEIFSPAEIKQYFFPIADEFLADQKVWAAPLFGNFLVMISNAALLQDDRIFVANRPGKTWAELLQNFINFQEFGSQKIYPISLGDTQISPHTFEIFLTLLMQSEARLFSEKNIKDALLYLLKFTQHIPNTINTEELSFLQGKIGVIFGDENTYLRLKESLRARQKTKSEYLQDENLELHLLPQFRQNNMQTYGDVWGLAVSKRAQNKSFSWALAASFSDEQKAKELFLKTHQTPLLTAIDNGIFSETALYASTVSEWQKLDFSSFFDKNIQDFLRPNDSNITFEIIDVVHNIQDFFSAP